MKANELRIGNYIDRNGLMEVVGISNSGVRIFDHVNNIGHRGNWKFDKNIKPIPLTEDWLKKFGFDDSEYKKGYVGKDFEMGNGMVGDFVLTKPGHMGEFQKQYAFELRNHRFVTVPHIHELQNLYFALTGKELEYESN